MNEIYIKDMIDRKEEIKRSLNSNIKIYENFKLMHHYDRERLNSIINATDGSQINKLTNDVNFIINRMKKVLKNIKINLGKYLKNDDSNILEEITELIYLFVSYSYSIMMINNEELNTKYPIKKYEQKRSKLFDQDGISNVIIGIRNGYHHGTFFYAKYNSEYDENGKKLFFIISKDVLLNSFEFKNGEEKLRIKDRGKEYLDKKSRLDILSLFEEYLRRTEVFFSWYKKERESKYKNELLDYKELNDNKIILDRKEANNIVSQFKNIIEKE